MKILLISLAVVLVVMAIIAVSVVYVIKDLNDELRKYHDDLYDDGFD